MTSKEKNDLLKSIASGIAANASIVDIHTEVNTAARLAIELINEIIKLVEIKIKNESFEKFNKWVDENATNVRRIKNQMTEEQFAKLKEKYNSQQIMQIILNLENYKDAPKKYTSVYLTVNNWLKKDTNNLK